MFTDGTYTAWFRTPRGQGTAIVHLAGGIISGGDSFFRYSGSYAVEGEHFTATLSTSRVADGPTTVFGLDEVELELVGVLKGAIATCTGSSAQAPGVTFEATLFLGQGPSAEPPAPPPLRPAPPSNVARLPKPGSERPRGRNPFTPGSR